MPYDGGNSPVFGKNPRNVRPANPILEPQQIQVNADHAAEDDVAKDMELMLNLGLTNSPLSSLRTEWVDSQI